MAHFPFVTVLILLFSAISLTCAIADDETTLSKDAIPRLNVVYAARPTGQVKLDLLLPPAKGPWPLVIWIHGGAWKMGDKAAWPHMNFLVAKGFAVANVEYRFSQVAPFPAQLDDCSAALDFLISHAGEYHIAASRIAITGESAGGHLAAMVAMTRSRSTTQPAAQVKAVIDLFGPTDLMQAANDPKLSKDIAQLFGGPTASREDAIKDASPINHVSKDLPPFLIFHGTADPLVPFDQSKRLVEAMKSAGASVEFVPVKDAGHAGPAFWTAEQREKMVKFLRDNLKAE